MFLIFCMNRGRKCVEEPDVKLSMSATCRDPSLLEISNHLWPKNIIVTKKLVRNFQKNSLEPILFERLNSIRLSQPKHLVTSFVGFSAYRQSFVSLPNLLSFIVTKYITALGKYLP